MEKKDREEFEKLIPTVEAIAAALLRRELLIKQLMMLERKGENIH